MRIRRPTSGKIAFPKQFRSVSQLKIGTFVLQSKRYLEVIDHSSTYYLLLELKFLLHRENMCLSNREVQEKSARLLKGVRNYLGQRNAFQGRRFGEEYRSVIYVRLRFFFMARCVYHCHIS